MSSRGIASRPALALTALALSLALVIGLALELERSAAPPAAATLALVDATGLSDLFLSSSSRWLRHPSITERAAALSDAPDGLDVDPGGLAIRSVPEPEGARFERTAP